MGEITERQAEHLQTLLDEQGMTQRELAAELGFSTTTVNRWLKGKAKMRGDSAELIHERWPEYPIEWLQGGADACERLNDLWERIEQFRTDVKHLEGAVIALIQSARYSYEETELESAQVAITDNEKPTDAKRIDFDIGSNHKISKDGSELVLDATSWTLLLFEMTRYIDMRISCMMADANRGGARR